MTKIEPRIAAKLANVDGDLYANGHVFRMYSVGDLHGVCSPDEMAELRHQLEKQLKRHTGEIA